MCVAGFADTASKNIPVLGVANVLLNTTSSIISQKANNDYRTQVALNNAKYAQNEAHRQQQLGIEKSRVEKISALQEASKLQASQASSNMDIYSSNSSKAYQDIITNSEINSQLIKNEYNSNANDYFKQANSYLNQIDYYNKAYNKGLISTGVSALGEFSKVTKDWFSPEGSDSL